MTAGTAVQSVARQFDAPAGNFREDVLHGLRGLEKQIPCKYFYDEAGSLLFERITRLKEYYLTPAELGIMRRHASKMASLLGKNCLLIEYGSGSSLKTRLLLNHLKAPAAYMPVDISGEHLRQSAAALAERYPEIRLVPICADFTSPAQLPVNSGLPKHRVVYFPGSTIGNFTPEAAVDLLRQSARLCGPGGGLLMGVDLKKNPATIEAAYNDSQGVTAAFNFNLLVRINRELGADFQINQFWHHAFYNPREGRIEMHLVSHRNQRVHIGDEEIIFNDGETIRTEYSYKYSMRDLQNLAADSGFTIRHQWVDKRKYFCVVYLGR
jgi:dimethylhistidine N-methyltransferase